MRVNGRLLKIICMAALTFAFVYAYAQTTLSTTVTVGTTTELATVTGLSPSFSKAPVSKMISRESDLDLFKITNIDDTYYNQLVIRLILTNPDQLKRDYTFMTWTIKIYDYTGGTVGQQFGSAKILSLEKPVVEFYTEDWLTYTENSDLLVRADVVYRCSKPGASTAPTFYLEVEQA
jgi:hypothetical protein